MTKIKMMIIAGGLLGLWGCAWLLWFLIPNQDLIAISAVTIFLVALADSVAGMWQGKNRALWKSRFLAVVVFAFGCYIAHFVWTFWLFTEPTFMQRVQAVLRPQVFLFLIIPVLWLILSFLPAVRSRFQPNNLGKKGVNING